MIIREVTEAVLQPNANNAAKTPVQRATLFEDKGLFMCTSVSACLTPHRQWPVRKFVAERRHILLVIRLARLGAAPALTLELRSAWPILFEVFESVRQLGGDFANVARDRILILAGHFVAVGSSHDGARENVTESKEATNGEG